MNIGWPGWLSGSGGGGLQGKIFQIETGNEMQKNPMIVKLNLNRPCLMFADDADDNVDLFIL